MTTTEAPPPARATRREWLGLAVLALAALMYVMDLTVLHLAVPKMSADLQPSSTELLWIIDIYGFFVAGALITMGSLGVVGSAPPERAGAASGISETGAELGGALGLALLGSIGVAIYRGALSPSVLSALPPDAANAARGTLGGAVGVADSLPAAAAETLLAVARAAFTDGMHVAAAIAGVVGLGLAAFAFASLRERGTERSATEPICVEPTMIDQPVLVPVGKPARECF